MTSSATARTAGVLTALAVTTVAAQRSRLPGDLVVPAGAVLLVVGGRASGLGWDEMGLDAAAMGRTLPAAAAAAGLTVACIGAVAAHPAALTFRDNGRYATPAAARRAALGTIPLSVAVPEEVVFRGVLDASLRRHLSPGAADLAGALAFGVWHVLGARSLGSGRRGRVLGLGTTVAATAAAGLAFTALRRCAGSVLPGVAGHWALNASAAHAAALAT